MSVDRLAWATRIAASANISSVWFDDPQTSFRPVPEGDIWRLATKVALEVPDIVVGIGINAWDWPPGLAAVMAMELCSALDGRVRLTVGATKGMHPEDATDVTPRWQTTGEWDFTAYLKEVRRLINGAVTDQRTARRLDLSVRVKSENELEAAIEVADAVVFAADIPALLASRVSSMTSLGPRSSPKRIGLELAVVIGVTRERAQRRALSLGPLGHLAATVGVAGTADDLKDRLTTLSESGVHEVRLVLPDEHHLGDTIAEIGTISR
jgi:hypothetical protein